MFSNAEELLQIIEIDVDQHADASGTEYGIGDLLMILRHCLLKLSPEELADVDELRQRVRSDWE